MPGTGTSSPGELPPGFVVGEYRIDGVAGMNQSCKRHEPPDQVIELHGNGTYARCLSCGERHELDWVKREFERTHNSPGCTSCGGFVKSATISFGQPMPEAEMARARAATLETATATMVKKTMAMTFLGSATENV